LNSSLNIEPSRFSLGGLRLRAIFLVLLAVIPLLGLTLYSYLEQRAEAIAEAQRDAVLVVKFVAKIQQTLLQDTNQLFQTLTQLPQVLHQDPEGCKLLFARVIENHENYTALIAAHPNGKVFASAPGTSESLDVKDRPWFKSVIQSRDMVIGEPQVGRVSGRFTLPIAFPVQNPTGQLTAVLATGLDLEWLGKFILQTGLPDKSTLLMTDSSGKVMFKYPNPEKYVGKQMSESPIIKTMISRKEGVMEGACAGGVSRLYGFTRFSSPNQEFYAAVGIPKDVAFADIDRSLKRNLLYLGLVTLLVVTAAWFGGGLFIVRPIKKLQGVTQQLTAGDLGVRTGPPYRSGEMGLLARDFDQMADAIQERDTRLKQAAGELNRRLLELNAAYKELESFSYTVAHDLRAPLRGIGGFSRILLEDSEDKLDAEGIRCLNIIQSEIKKMGNLIDDLLAFSRLGRREIRPVDLNMEDLAGTVSAGLQKSAPERNLQIQIQPLPPARGDRELIRQVLENLLGNALKFTAPKEVAVIEVTGEAKEEETVYCVKDNGVGFEMEYAPKLFEVFQRLHPESEFPGTGMGLAIVQRIVQRHRGRVWGEGKVGEGARFCFSLPKEAAEDKVIEGEQA
jgi:signal transduction histidine kinase